MTAVCEYCGSSGKHDPACDRPVDGGGADADIKLSTSAPEDLADEKCWLCGHDDGRLLPEAICNRHLCDACARLTIEVLWAIKIRLGDHAIYHITRTGRDIVKAINAKGR